MSREGIEGFFGRLREDRDLQEEYWTVLATAAQSAVVELAARHRFELTDEDLRREWSEQAAELSDEQLEAVAGGLGGHSLRSVEQRNALLDFAGNIGFFRVAGGVEGIRRLPGA